MNHAYTDPYTRRYIQKQSPEVFYKKGVLENFAKFTVKHLCQSLFFNKNAGLRSETLAMCFLVNFAKFLRPSFLQNTSGRFLLYIDTYIHTKINRCIHTNISIKLEKQQLILITSGIIINGLIIMKVVFTQGFNGNNTEIKEPFF